MDDEKILQAAIERWGAEAQTLKALEELGELISAVARQECAWKASLRDERLAIELSPELLRGIYEELADARIMLRQLEMIYACRAAVERWERAKLARLAERLGLTEGGGPQDKAEFGIRNSES